jgi:hypothetical protein
MLSRLKSTAGAPRSTRHPPGPLDGDAERIACRQVTP